MYCQYYSKYGFLKRIKGTTGFCELQKCDIMKEETVGRIPYEYCEGANDKSNLQCGVYQHYGKKRRTNDERVN